MTAQTATLSPVGEYYLRGVMETASGFKLDKDGTFQFFLSYGALDRFGSGVWMTRDDHIFFNSPEKHSSDFALIQSKKQGGDGITVKIIDSNAMMLRHVYCLIQSGNKKQQAAANAEGNMFFAAQDIESVTLLFEFCPERESIITIPVKDHNYFEFRFEPWVMEVFFKNFSLRVNEMELSGAHPILEGSNYRYEKAGKQ